MNEKLFWCPNHQDKNTEALARSLCIKQEQCECAMNCLGLTAIVSELLLGRDTGC